MCKFIANFSATMVTSLPSHYFRLSLSLSLSHRLYLTHNIGSASALPIIGQLSEGQYNTMHRSKTMEGEEKLGKVVHCVSESCRT